MPSFHQSGTLLDPPKAKPENPAVKSSSNTLKFKSQRSGLRLCLLLGQKGQLKEQGSWMRLQPSCLGEDPTLSKQAWETQDTVGM